MLLLLMSVSEPAWLDNESKRSIMVNPDAGTGARLGATHGNLWDNIRKDLVHHLEGFPATCLEWPEILI